MSPSQKSFGRLWLDDGLWHAECQPHVMMRLKRIFNRISKNQFSVITLADSPEICRELLWFCARFPLTTNEKSYHYLKEQSEKHRLEEHAVHQVLSGEVKPKNFDLRLPLRDYQRIGTDLALKTGGILIADDVGIGKTAQAIAMFTDQRTLPALVVTLTHLPFQWQSEIKRFAPELETCIIKTGKFYPVAKNGVLPDVLIINYHKLRGWAEFLAGKIRCIVFDEVQELRTGRSSYKGSAAYHVASLAAFKVGLSATPIYNYGSEMFNVMEAIRPGSMGTPPEFAREWLSWNGKKVRDPKAFGTYLREHGLMIRRTREEVQRTLPILTKVPHWVDFDFDALDALTSSADELALAIANQSESGGQQERFATENEFRQALRQATGIGKAPYVAEFVRMLLQTGEKVVLYCWHREVYNLLLDRLKEFSPAMYSGSESPVKKQESFRRFTTSQTPLLLISLRSGAGLDGLQYHCRTVVFGELDWSPAVMEQCVGRVHRDGQLDNTTAYYLLAKGGSDPFVSSILGIKKAQIEGIKDPGGAAVPTYDVDNISIRKLALAYLEQRKKSVPKKRSSIVKKAAVMKALPTETTAELEEALIKFSEENSLMKLINEDLLEKLLQSFELEASPQLCRSLVKKLCSTIFTAACRAKLEKRTTVKSFDL